MLFLTTAMMLATLSYGLALDSPLSFTDSHGKTISTKSKCLQGTWACGSSTVPSDRIYICSPSGDYVLSAVCGGSGCCRFASNGLPFCYCWKKRPSRMTVLLDSTSEAGVRASSMKWILHYFYQLKRAFGVILKCKKECSILRYAYN